MKKSEWNDEQLEQMLSQMPRMKDNRKPQEIYQNITLKMNKQKKKVWMVPTIASVAAALLLFILAPSFINNMNSSSSDSAKMNREEKSIAMDINKEAASNDKSVSTIQKAEEPKSDDEVGIFSSEEQPNQSYAVNSVGKNQVLLTYGVYLGGVMFPTFVSIVVESDGQDVIEQWQKNIPQVNEFIRQNAEWGIDELPESYFADFSEVETKDSAKAVRVDVNNTIHTDSFASGQMEEFTHVINSFRYLVEDYQHAELFQNDQQGIMVGETGITENNIDLEKDTKKAYLYYMNEESGHKLLALTYEEFKTVKQALEAMKNDKTQGDYKLFATIITEIKDINEEGSNLEVYFSDDAVLENTDDNILMLDAIMLTAKEFNFDKVTFYGNIDQIGSVRFGEPTPVPLAPNPLPIQ
ncbi:GerMN domain-containing protein [Bacillus sp. 1P02SD]|uniref:GerMN domain-containing protein n=1 Tax=Bacillus sp. 1P02SD TaxID=3132264 RepID=UPI0039A31349